MSEARRFQSARQPNGIVWRSGDCKTVGWEPTFAPCAVLGVLALFATVLVGCAPSAPHDQASASLPPSSAVQDYNKAQALTGAGHCDRAIHLYLQAITKDSMYVSAYVALGYCYQGIGSLTGAITEFDKAIAVDPTNYGLYIARAGAEAISGNTGAAAADDSTALQLASPQVPTYTTIAGSFASYADFADALTAMNKAIALVPADPSLYEQRAGIYLQAKDFARAYADYRTAITVAPFLAARASVNADLANVYSQQGDYPSAYRAIATAIQLEPNNAHWYVQSASLHQTASAFTAALSLYGKALSLTSRGPDAETAHEGRGDVFTTLGQGKKAVEEYRQAAALAKADQGIQLRLKSKIKAAQSGQS